MTTCPESEGNIDNAIVCGTHMVFEPYVCQFQQETGLCSPRGVSAVLDQSADGFVKGEAVCGVFLQRRRNARRVYATVLSAKMNIDGNKTIGMFFPSAEAQEDLMVRSYTEANIDPLALTYFEAHCTGTKV
jgi:fatty acid synthase